MMKTPKFLKDILYRAGWYYRQMKKSQFYDDSTDLVRQGYLWNLLPAGSFLVIACILHALGCSYSTSVKYGALPVCAWFGFITIIHALLVIVMGSARPTSSFHWGEREELTGLLMILIIDQAALVLSVISFGYIVAASFMGVQLTYVHLAALVVCPPILHYLMQLCRMSSFKLWCELGFAASKSG